jgi:hypothetical protein
MILFISSAAKGTDRNLFSSSMILIQIQPKNIPIGPPKKYFETILKYLFKMSGSNESFIIVSENKYFQYIIMMSSVYDVLQVEIDIIYVNFVRIIRTLFHDERV